MLAEGESVITHVDDQSVFCQTAGFEIVQHCPNTVVNAHQRLGIAVKELVEADIAVIHVIHTVPRLPLCLHPVRESVLAIIISAAQRFAGCAGRGKGGFAILWRVERVGQNNGFVPVNVPVSLRRLELRVNCLMGQV